MKTPSAFFVLTMAAIVMTQQTHLQDTESRETFNKGIISLSVDKTAVDFEATTTSDDRDTVPTTYSSNSDSQHLRSHLSVSHKINETRNATVLQKEEGILLISNAGTPVSHILAHKHQHLKPLPARHYRSGVRRNKRRLRHKSLPSQSLGNTNSYSSSVLPAALSNRINSSSDSRVFNSSDRWKQNSDESYSASTISTFPRRKTLLQLQRRPADANRPTASSPYLNINEFRQIDELTTKGDGYNQSNSSLPYSAHVKEKVIEEEIIKKNYTPLFSDQKQTISVSNSFTNGNHSTSSNNMQYSDSKIIATGDSKQHKVQETCSNDSKCTESLPPQDEQIQNAGNNSQLSSGPLISMPQNQDRHRPSGPQESDYISGFQNAFPGKIVSVGQLSQNITNTPGYYGRKNSITYETPGTHGQANPVVTFDSSPENARNDTRNNNGSNSIYYNRKVANENSTHKLRHHGKRKSHLMTASVTSKVNRSTSVPVTLASSQNVSPLGNVTPHSNVYNFYAPVTIHVYNSDGLDGVFKNIPKAVFTKPNDQNFIGHGTQLNYVKNKPNVMQNTINEAPHGIYASIPPYGVEPSSFGNQNLQLNHGTPSSNLDHNNNSDASSYSQLGFSVGTMSSDTGSNGSFSHSAPGNGGSGLDSDGYGTPFLPSDGMSAGSSGSVSDPSGGFLTPQSMNDSALLGTISQPPDGVPYGESGSDFGDSGTTTPQPDGFPGGQSSPDYNNPPTFFQPPDMPTDPSTSNFGVPGTFPQQFGSGLSGDYYPDYGVNPQPSAGMSDGGSSFDITGTGMLFRQTGGMFPGGSTPQFGGMGTNFQPTSGYRSFGSIQSPQSFNNFGFSSSFPGHGTPPGFDNYAPIGQQNQWLQARHPYSSIGYGPYYPGQNSFSGYNGGYGFGTTSIPITWQGNGMGFLNIGAPGMYYNTYRPPADVWGISFQGRYTPTGTGPQYPTTYSDTSGYGYYSGTRGYPQPAFRAETDYDAAVPRRPPIDATGYAAPAAFPVSHTQASLVGGAANDAFRKHSPFTSRSGSLYNPAPGRQKFLNPRGNLHHSLG